ncbi:MAG: hypothetical protein KA436_11470 [Oligoflexales bacterium]|nr:hypothetical protein [Oligoflexales bacterium]
MRQSLDNSFLGRVSIYFCSVFLLLIISFQQLGAESISTADSGASSYSPPSSPELYDTEVPLTEEKAVPVKSGGHADLDFSLGKSSGAGGGPASDASYGLGLGVGYLKHSANFSFADFGIKLTTGYLGSELADVPVRIGLLGYFAHGYAISKGLYGMWSIEAGLSRVGYKENSSTSIKSKDDVVAFVWGLGYDLLTPMTKQLQFVGGLHFQQHSFRVKELEKDGVTVPGSKSVTLNNPHFKLGLRLAL